MKKPVTIYDIAKALKLTGSTVSRALRDRSDVGEETKKKVLAQAKKMRYQPNLVAANLRNGKTKALGIVVPEINNHFFANVIAGIEHVSYQHGYNLIICQTNELFEKEVESVKMLMNHNVAGIIISLSKTTLNTLHLLEAKAHQIRVIQFDRTDSKFDSLRIINNNFESAVNAVKHLHEQGYQRPAFLAGPRDVNIFQERYEGFRKGLELAGLPFTRKNVAFDCLTKEKAKSAMVKMLTGPSRPDAVLASADLAALGALEAANELGINVPSELGICGFSNEPYTELTNPTLSTVDQYSIEMGKRIMEAFIGSPGRKKTPDPIIVNADVVVRRSTNRLGLTG
ncbi:MAG: LacI family DNA-binding transcriptional regulator [Bacteroidota bacterium]